MRRPGLLLGAALALLAALPAPARASSNQESMFQDDNRLVYGTPDVVASTLDTLRALGVDRIRVSVFWRIVAPGGDSKQRPSFDAADPAGYPQDKWDRYDALVEAAQSRGIGVDFNITSPAPLWATGSPDRADIEETYNPSAAEFGKFVQASGAYAGSHERGSLPIGARRPARPGRCRASTTGRSGTSPTRPAGSRPSGRPTRRAAASSSRPRPPSTAGWWTRPSARCWAPATGRTRS